jgi:hypothetical protein
MIEYRVMFEVLQEISAAVLMNVTNVRNRR